jgi:hypothetical protein
LPIFASVVDQQKGNCQSYFENSTVDISKIPLGVWYMAYLDHEKGQFIPFLNPFHLKFRYDYCTFVRLTRAADNLKMTYGCRDKHYEDYPFHDQCEYYVKFTKNGTIKYEIATGCALEMNQKLVRIWRTDYRNYIIVKGCTVRARDYVLRQKESFLILVKQIPDPSIIKEVASHFELVDRKRTTVEYLLTQFNHSTSWCECEQYVCKERRGICYPMQYIRKTTFEWYFILIVIFLMLCVTVVCAFM